MSIFRFKRFEVKNEKSAMKVNTDGVLLGAAVPISLTDNDILDIGTGTGAIALMLAQKVSDKIPGWAEKVTITGIDIDPDAAEEAGTNFRNSTWSEALHSRHISLKDLDSEGSCRKFSLIVSNPPYYDSSLTNPDSRKATARHTGDSEGCGLSFREVLDFASRHLTGDGRVAMILPADQETALLGHGRMLGLYPSAILRIRTVERKKPSRIIVSFSREKPPTKEDMLTIMENGRYTAQYISLTKDFYLFA